MTEPEPQFPKEVQQFGEAFAEASDGLLKSANADWDNIIRGNNDESGHGIKNYVGPYAAINGLPSSPQIKDKMTKLLVAFAISWQWSRLPTYIIKSQIESSGGCESDR